jgi:hypothetical protein
MTHSPVDRDARAGIALTGNLIFAHPTERRSMASPFFPPHPDYEKNIEKLKDEGFRFPEFHEFPAHLRGFAGNVSVLINSFGIVRGVDRMTGEVSDLSEKPAPVCIRPPRPRQP